MAVAELPSLAFDDIVIDFAGRRLLRAGVVQPLEPKAFAVLALLAGTPGQAFSRDDILDAVWGHRHVTPGVLNRVMTLLRHALGEDGQAPRYLHTLHGMGYRFDLPHASGHPVLEESVGDGAPLQRRSSDRAAPASARPGLRRIALAACLLLAFALLALWWPRHNPVPTDIAQASAVPIPTLIVMPLQPIGASDREFAAGLSDELISALARIDGLRVIASESTALATAQPTSPMQLVERLGISHALEGSLRQSGEQLRVHLRLVAAGDGRTLWAQDYDRAMADVFALEREIAQAVATALALKLGLEDGPRSRGGDADFLRRYYAAISLMKADTRHQPTVEQAETQFRALVRERPDDARAHAGLATALDFRAFRRPPLAEPLREEAAREAEFAIRLDPSLPEPYEVQATAACRANAWERCFALFRKVMALAPSGSQSSGRYAMSLAALGYLDQAEQSIRRGLERDRLNPNWHFALGRILDTQGRHKEALAPLERSGIISRYSLWFNAVWRGDYDAARRRAKAMTADPLDNDAYARVWGPSYVLATEALIDPRQWPAAERAMRESEQMTGLMNFIAVLQPGRDPAALIAGLDTVRRRSYSSWDLLLWTKDLAYLRRHPAFQDYLRRNGILAYWRQHGFPPQCRPHGDGALCE